MNQRYELIQKLKQQITDKVKAEFTDEKKYVALLKSLIMECLIKLWEPNVELNCLSKEVPLLKQIIPDVEKDFYEYTKKECPIPISTKITIDETKPLETFEKNCIGGVQLSCYYGRIVCKNSLLSRINLICQEALPDMRKQLFFEQ
eukprot:TRINITY_DN4990_c0_g1_i1.p3 TRINITY_DN4990_c0_g1~~TRINITY_DN4990_c0_g1_i1.p3  ORF type:complete len:146 (+),score=36.34 TRINITY_DN4990_c0_g1_i1:116-553(+)